MRRFLARQDVDCRCGHSPRQHDESHAQCTAQDTRYMFKKTDRGRPCVCARYRPSLIAMIFDFWP